MLGHEFLQPLNGLGGLILGEVQLNDFEQRLASLFGRHPIGQVLFIYLDRVVQAAEFLQDLAMEINRVGLLGPQPGGDTGGGIFISDDAGLTWRRARAASEHVYDVTIDPRSPDVMYACGFDQGVFRSTDRGETWRRIPGFNFKWGQRVVTDPVDAARIYVTTFGGGIWHGPAAGDPASAEDVVGATGPSRPGDGSGGPGGSWR
jgi:hypothetical protein